MGVFVALLRGVNVGRNILKMELLRSVCLQLGLADVRTHVQSGNVVFAAPGPAGQWAKKLEQALVGHARLPIAVILRTADEMRAIVRANPFAEPGALPNRLGVTFLGRVPAAAAVKALEPLCGEAERCQHLGRELYLHLPAGFGQTKLTNAAIEKALSVRATQRNWNTVMRLAEMANG